MKAIELKNEKSPKLVTPQIPELKSKWPKCRGSPNLSFEHPHAWQLKSCRFESSLSQQFCTKKCLLLFIRVMSQKIPSVPYLTIKSEGLRDIMQNPLNYSLWIASALATVNVEEDYHFCT